MDIDNYLQTLDAEIKNVEDEASRALQQERLEQAMATYSGEDEIISSLEIYKQAKEGKTIPTVSTGFHDLDALLKGGFSPKQLIVLSAATKSGKTSFCIDLTTKMRELNPCWLPFEESAEEIVLKFDEWGEEPPLFYTPRVMKGDTLEWVEKKVVEAKVKFNSKLFFIDHLHFIVPLTANRMDAEIGRTMRELKRMAKLWDITIVLIAHIRKTRMVEQPTLEDLRDSSFIAQEADTVLMLWRQTVKDDNGSIQITDNVNLSVQAVRRAGGKPGNIKLVFRDGHFLPIEWELTPTAPEPHKAW